MAPNVPTRVTSEFGDNSDFRTSPLPKPSKKSFGRKVDVKPLKRIGRKAQAY